MILKRIRRTSMEFRINQAKDNYDRTTEEYIVAYIDILGTTNLIRSDDQNEALNLMHNLYSFFTSTTSEIAIPENKDLKFKIFSDNIIIANKLSSNTKQREKDIRCLLMAASHFQIDSVGDGVGYLVRGGITIGDLFIDDTIVFGKALVDSYILEDKTALYPRIIFDTKTINEIKKYKDLNSFILQDFDDLFFLNYLSIWHFCGEMLYQGFEKIKSRAKNKVDERLLQKLNWHKNFVNRQLANKGENVRLDIDNLINNK